MTATNTSNFFLVFDQFLTRHDLSDVRAFALEMVGTFEQATTVQMGQPGTLDLARRRARVLAGANMRGVGESFRKRIEGMLPPALESLKLPKSSPKRISVQMTSTGDGGFYKPHTDNSPKDAERRVLSFVYFCGIYPSGFQGGDLRIYATRDHKQLSDPNLQVHIVSPQQNRLVLFKSDYVHEISLVVCKSKQLVDTRLTVNGWIYF